jgi:hypothetical protein
MVLSGETSQLMLSCRRKEGRYSPVGAGVVCALAVPGNSPISMLSMKRRGTTGCHASPCPPFVRDTGRMSCIGRASSPVYGCSKDTRYPPAPVLKKDRAEG